MRNDLLRALAGQRVEATPVMGDAEKTTILAATPGGYGTGYGQDDGWDDEDEAARRRRRKIIAIVAVLGVLLLGGAIAAAIALSGDKTPPAAAQVKVPALQNLEQAAAEKAITDAGLKVGAVDTAASATVAQGHVISSDPAGGASVNPGSEVKLVVSAGPDTVAVPNVVGLTEDRARQTLKDAGFTSVSSGPADSLEDEGKVVSVDPAEGQQAAKNTTIRLKVSTGTVKVPDVAGKTEDEARKILTDAGFSSGQIQRADADAGTAAPGTVVSTNPGAGTAAGRGDVITLKVAKADDTRAVPDVKGQNEAQARATLAAAGFTKIARQDTEGDGQPPGTAVGTDPAAGTKAAPDDEIVLLVVGG
jgi:serine/threonine-protein kinase